MGRAILRDPVRRVPLDGGTAPMKPLSSLPPASARVWALYFHYLGRAGDAGVVLKEGTERLPTGGCSGVEEVGHEQKSDQMRLDR